jgi:hypothetical protein
MGPAALALLCLALISVTITHSSSRAPQGPPDAQVGQAVVSKVRKVALVTKDILVHPATQTLYASLPGSAGPAGNSVVPINPSMGTVGTPVYVGSEPDILAFSGDGQYLYVGLDGEAAVRQFVVATRAAGLKFPLGEGQAGDLSVMPGAPNTVAVSRPSWGIAVYENGVKRDLVAGLGDGAFGVEFSNSPSVLYTSASFGSLGKVTVGACGADIALRSPGLITVEMRYDNGRVYTTFGRVIDAEAGTLVGTFDVPVLSGVSQGPVFTTDSKAGRIYLIYSDGTGLRLRVFDIKTLVVLGELKLPGVTGGQVTSLVRWGADGLAFRTDVQVYVLQNQLIAAPTPLPPFTPAPAATPLNFTVQSGISALNTPTPGVTINYSGARNGTTQTDAAGRFSIADLPLCSTLTVTPSRPFWTFTPSSVTITNPSTQTANFSSFHNMTGFAITQTSASEGAHSVFLPVVRSVNGYGAATLSYTVTPGTASERNDYTGRAARSASSRERRRRPSRFF